MAFLLKGSTSFYNFYKNTKRFVVFLENDQYLKKYTLVFNKLNNEDSPH